MIARIWHGWTAPADADAFEQLMCATVIPAFEARQVAGLMQIDLLRGDAGGDDVEFTTVMLFDTVEAIARFAGDDLMRAHVVPEMHALLARADVCTSHHAVIDRRVQADHARGRP